MFNVGGYNNSLTDFYANELAGRPKAKEDGGMPGRTRAKDDGGVPGRPKAKDGGRIGPKTETYEPSKAGMLSQAGKTAKAAPVSQVNQTSAANEANLSQKAKDYLKNLREANEDFDFFVANGDDETEGVLGSGSKEYAVAFSNEELEKMADDEEYAQKMLDGIGMAMDMADRISEDLDLENQGITFNRMNVTINDDGSMSIFAELQKSADRQREQIEAAREHRIEERKAAEKEKKAAEEEAKSEEAKETKEAEETGDGEEAVATEGRRPGRPRGAMMRRFENAYGRPQGPMDGPRGPMGGPQGPRGPMGGPQGPMGGPDARRTGAYGGNEILRTTLSADSEDDLLDQIAHIDWNQVATDQKKQGDVPHFESAI